VAKFYLYLSYFDPKKIVTSLFFLQKNSSLLKQIFDSNDKILNMNMANLCSTIFTFDLSRLFCILNFAWTVGTLFNTFMNTNILAAYNL